MMGSKGGTILNETKFHGFHKDRRKHYVVLFTQNQGNFTDASRTGCQSSF